MHGQMGNFLKSLTMAQRSIIRKNVEMATLAWGWALLLQFRTRATNTTTTLQIFLQN